MVVTLLKHPLRTTDIPPDATRAIERVEFQYTRHGTQCLIANPDVVTGTLLAPTVGETRTEADFVMHLQQTVALAPQGTWIFWVAQLNRVVAK